RDGSVNASGADSALARTGVEQEPSRDAGADALRGPELGTREGRQWIIEKSLRRDKWSIFRAGFYSGRGGLDVIAGRGHSRDAVQCHVPERGEPLDETGLRNLLSAPFDVHSIVEVVVVTQSGVLPEARQMATSSTLRIHLIDGTALEAWRHWVARLEPQCVPVSVIKRGRCGIRVDLGPGHARRNTRGGLDLDVTTDAGRVCFVVHECASGRGTLEPCPLPSLGSPTMLG